VKGRAVPVWHNDHSRPEKPITRSLEEEIARVVRARATNPKWISAMMRHGYKGAFEIAATLDYMFAFAATTGAVKSYHFEAAFDAWLRDDAVREWLAAHNPAALADMAARFDEAMARGFWRPRANDAAALLAALRAETRETETP
jgi:cobaltochelatase CobN